MDILPVVRWTKLLDFGLLKIWIQMLLFWISSDFHTISLDIITSQDIPIKPGELLPFF